MFNWWRKRITDKRDPHASIPQSRPALLENRWAKEGNVLTVNRPFCHCLDAQHDDSEWRELSLHSDVQDFNCPGWLHLLDLIEEAATDGRAVFAPGREIEPGDWTQIVTLPASISKLKSVKHLILYGSSLVRIPTEIGEMSSLEEFTPYTSYRLHWFPYEITRCRNLKRSTVSTRALYGNFKYRPPFPRLPQRSSKTMPDSCSVCGGSMQESKPQQVWMSLPVATDVLPLLVNAYSEDCIRSLPDPPQEYVAGPHSGGLELIQPGTRW